MILCARDDFPAGTVGELLDYARKNPGRVTYGSVGAASPNHIVHEELARLAEAKMLHVPYSGESPIVTALLSRDIDIAYVTVAVATNFINSGKFKALAAGGPERSANFPNLATVGEQIKTKEYSAYTWTVLVTAKGTPPAILERLNVALNEILGDPQVKERMEKLGLATLGGDVRAAQEFISRELSRYEIMIRDNNIKRE